MRYLIVLAIVVIALSLTRTPAVAADQACSQPPTTEASGQVTVTGDGKLNTRPFDLVGGAYTVRWSGTSRNQFGGNLMIDLERADGQTYGDSLVNTILGSERPTASGETQIYNVKPGTYYFKVLAPAEWTVTISPQ